MNEIKRLKELEELFQQLLRKIARESNKIDKEISGSQAFILDILDQKGPQKVSDIAEELGITLAGVTNLSDRLLASGFIQRDRSEVDRRIVLLQISSKGMRALKDFKDKSRELMKKIYGELSQEDIDHLIRIYKSILLK